MEDNRLRKFIFKWDKIFRISWSSYVKSLFIDLDMREIFDSETLVSLNTIWAFLFEKKFQKQTENIQQKPKLCTYVTFKESYNAEP